MRFANNIQIKLGVLILIFFISLVSSIYLVFSIINKQKIKNDVFSTIKVISQKVDGQIEQQLTNIEVLVKVLANFGETLDSNHNENKKVLKNLINLNGYEKLIAGGGIWPEPYMLDKTKQRSSYFFGRNKEGNLDFYNDYNINKEGYHHEEWYLPTKFYENGHVYWSKSYIDPYSYEPMVTVSSPIYRDEKFIGVSTVDIMLYGLKDLLKKNIEQFGGYGFIVDRNNKFLTYPDDDMAKVNNDYITFSKLAKSYPQYNEINNLLLKNNEISLSSKYKDIATTLEKESPSIDKLEAKKIAMLIKDSHLNHHHLDDLKTIVISKDPILHEKSIAITIKQPNTHWTLVVVIPIKTILSQSNKIFNNLIIVISILIAIFSVVGYFAIRRNIIKPMSLMTAQLDAKTEQLQKLNETLNERVKEEVFKNIEKDKKMLENSRLAQMGEMISMIAHQWRQPLNAISATASNLKFKTELETFDLDTKDGQIEQNRYFLDEFQKINSYVQTLTQTIDDFRNFYKPNKSSVSITFEAVVNKSLGIILPSLKTSNIKIVTEYNSDAIIQMHDNEIMQVILNILKNAQDNFKEKDIVEPTITIMTKDKELSICDNGGGIPERIIYQIFDPYFSTKDEKNGTGLGLYMSRTIVQEHHDAKLEVENIPNGVCFRIVF